MRASDFEPRISEKLDNILSKLCELVARGQSSAKDYGMVAAAVLDPSNQVVARLNRPGKDGKRIHAEHAAMEAYQQQYGDIPSGSIVITTLSPCNEHMDERDGPSCTDLINQSVIKKVYCGYMDPTQDDDTRQFDVLETDNKEIRQQCKAFADTFLGNVHEATFGGQEVEGNAYEKFKDKFPNLSTVLYFIPGLSQALVAADMASAVHMYNQAIAQIEQKYPFKIIRTVQVQVGDDTPLEPIDDFTIGSTDEDFDPNGVPPGPETKPSMPAGTVKVDVSDVYDWYKLGMDVSNLDLAKPSNYGKGPPSAIMAFGSEEEEHKYIDALKKLGLTTTDIDPLDPKQPKSMPRQKLDPRYNTDENFADGKNPQDKGDSARHGIPKHASISSLRKIAKQGGRKGQLAHWQANMRSGKNK
jgi:pyrimidine deaminase RibD-like protein